MMVQLRSFRPEPSRRWSNAGHVELNSTTAAHDDDDDDDDDDEDDDNNCRQRKVKVVETEATNHGKKVQNVNLVSSEARGPALGVN